jgi:hypothetical protein
MNNLNFKKDNSILNGNQNNLVLNNNINTNNNLEGNNACNSTQSDLENNNNNNNNNNNL